jgi:predicted glycoside hydrolase/deacetylase ChbG (UPF0249 family)
MIGKLGQGGYIFENICIALFRVLGHIDSHKHIHRIFDIFKKFLSEYAESRWVSTVNSKTFQCGLIH